MLHLNNQLLPSEEVHVPEEEELAPPSDDDTDSDDEIDQLNEDTEAVLIHTCRADISPG